MTSPVNVSELADRLATGHEIAIIDVRLREEYVAAHPIIASSLPSDEFDVQLSTLVPGRETQIFLVGDADSVERSRAIAADAGYGDVTAVGGVEAWRAAGAPLFEDINTLPKAFGEFVEHAYRTPSVSAAELARKLAAGGAVALVDCRPENEYVAGHLPGAIHIPGTDLLGVAAELQRTSTEIVIHCGGRTRGIVATQILRDLELPVPVSVFENGTFGWELAGFDLETGHRRQDISATTASIEWAEQATGRLAARFGFEWASRPTLKGLQQQTGRRSIYLIDLRSEAPVRIAGATTLSGGQLIQTVDSHVATQNAPIILIADQTFAAIATASWLVRLGWRRVVLARPDDALEVFGPATAAGGEQAAPRLAPHDLAAWLTDANRDAPLILDLSPSHHYVAGHLAGAHGVRRADLLAILARQPEAAPVVLTSADPRVAAAAWQDLPEARRANAFVLDGKRSDWQALGLPSVVGPAGALSGTPWLNEQLATRWRTKERDLAAFVDAELERFAAPHGVATLEDAKQGYLDWEIGLIDRIAADATLRFRAD